MPRLVRAALRRFALVAAFGSLAGGCVHDWAPYEPRSDAADVVSDAVGDTMPVDVQCAAPLENCNGVCVDLSNDIGHCGSCNRRCRRGADCMMGSCQ